MEEENVPVWGFPASNGGIAVCRWREGVVAEEGEEGGTTKGEEGGGNNAKFPSRRKAREQRLSSIIKDKSPFEPRTRSRDLTQPDHFFSFCLLSSTLAICICLRVRFFPRLRISLRLPTLSPSLPIPTIELICFLFSLFLFPSLPIPFFLLVPLALLTPSHKTPYSDTFYGFCHTLYDNEWRRMSHKYDLV